jgi:hypothetical protein
MTERLPDWEARLADYLIQWDGASYAYGTADCAKFAAGAIEAQTGVDYYAPFAGQYDSATSAAKALRSIGAGTLKKTFDKHLAERAVAFARRGDIVFDGNAVGVCVGADGVFIGQEGENEGLVRKARHEWTRAWAVGDE